MYNYKAELSRVIDGDTVDVILDLGFHLKIDVRVRLLDINTYELNSPNERLRGLAKLEKKNLEGILDRSPNFTVRTEKTGKYGRWLGLLVLENGKIVNDMMKEYHKTIANYNL